MLGDKPPEEFMEALRERNIPETEGVTFFVERYDVSESISAIVDQRVTMRGFPRNGTEITVEMRQVCIPTEQGYVWSKPVVIDVTVFLPPPVMYNMYDVNYPSQYTRQSDWAGFGEALRRRDEEEEKRMDDANRRAEQLLISCLDEEQRYDYEKRGSFFIRTKKGAYEIRKNRSMNITFFENGVMGGVTYCAVPDSRSDLPVCDVMLSQKLWIENNIGEFLLVANTF